MQVETVLGGDWVSGQEHLYNWFMNSMAGWTPAAGENWARMALDSKMSPAHIKGSLSWFLACLRSMRAFVLNLASLGILQASLHLVPLGSGEPRAQTIFVFPLMPVFIFKPEPL